MGRECTLRNGESCEHSSFNILRFHDWLSIGIVLGSVEYAVSVAKRISSGNDAPLLFSHVGRISFWQSA